jgi:hypothetical protein
MTKNIQAFKQYMKEGNHELCYIERFMISEYNIYHSFTGNDLFSPPIRYNYCDAYQYYIPDNKHFMYSNNSVLMIFPLDGIRISCSMNFAKNISIVNERLTGKWDDSITQLTYIDREGNVKTGPYIYITDATLDTFLFTKNYKYKVDYETETSFENLYNCVTIVAEELPYNKKNN